MKAELKPSHVHKLKEALQGWNGNGRRLAATLPAVHAAKCRQAHGGNLPVHPGANYALVLPCCRRPLLLHQPVLEFWLLCVVQFSASSCCCRTVHPIGIATEIPPPLTTLLQTSEPLGMEVEFALSLLGLEAGPCSSFLPPPPLPPPAAGAAAPHPAAARGCRSWQGKRCRDKSPTLPRTQAPPAAARLGKTLLGALGSVKMP